MGRYLPIFSFEVMHGFYTDGLCRELDCVATPQTNMIISKTGLLTRNLPNGVRVFYEEDRLDALRMQAADQNEPLELTFKVFSQDDLFVIFTEAPTYSDDGILSVDNSTVANDSGANVRLHQAEYLSEADLENLSSTLLDDVFSPRDLLVKPLMVVKIRFTSAEAELLGGQTPVAPKTYFVNFRAAERVLA